MALVRLFTLVTLFCLASLLFLLEAPPEQSHLPDPLSKHRLYPSNLTLVNLSHFKYLINNDVCSTERVYMLILVTSHPANRKLRESIRETLPQIFLNRFGVKRIFLLARAETNQSDYHTVNQHQIEAENLLSSDILMGNFIESYRNLTYKHTMGLQWASRYCSQSTWILKMDDDIAVDIFQILSLLPKLKYSQKMKGDSSEYLLGFLQHGMQPLRNTSSKWYVTWKEYPYSEYAPFLSGWAYILTPSIAAKLVDAAAKLPYFWIDDVHITGTIARWLGIKRRSLNVYYTVYTEFLQCCYNLPDHKRKLCDYAVGPTMGNSETMRKFLLQTKYCYWSHCERRTREEKIEKKCINVSKQSAVLGRGKGEVITLRL